MPETFNSNHFDLSESTNHGSNHGGQVYRYAGISGIGADTLLDFSANINPLGPPSSVIEAITKALPMVRHYPDSNQYAVKRILSKHFQVSPLQILCGNGASEVIDLLLQALRPTRVIVLEPAFSEYRKAAQRHRIPVLQLPLAESSPSESLVLRLFAADGFPAGETNFPSRQSLAQIGQKIQKDDLIFLNIPHNPTGVCLPLKNWLDYANQWLDKKATVVVDESFLDFLADETDYTAVHQAVLSQSLFVIRSATKFYSIPGLRFGFAIGPSQVIQQIETSRDGWSVNQLAQAAAEAAYQDKKFQEDTWRWLRRERPFVKKLWTERKEINARVDIHMGQVNFYLLRFKESEQGMAVKQYLQTKGMFLRDCRNFQGLGEGVYRVALKSHGENITLYKEICRSFN